MTVRGARGPRVVFSPFVGAFGGVERLILALSRFLSERDIPMELLCFRDTVGMAHRASWPLAVREIGAPRAAMVEAWQLSRFLRNVAVASPILAFDLKGAFYSVFASVPYVAHITDPPSLLPADRTRYALSAPNRVGLRRRSLRDLWRAPRAELVHQINRHAIGRAHTVITMTNAIAAEVRDLYGVESRVIRPGVGVADPDVRLNRGRGDMNDSVRFLSVCRLEATKRVDWILRALGVLTRNGFSTRVPTAWTLSVVGDGPERRRLEMLTGELGLSSRVTFHGSVPEPALEILYSEADIFIMPAIQGFGLPALESLVRKIPVVMHIDSGVSELLPDTPWVEIAHEPAGKDLPLALDRMVGRLVSGDLQKVSPPSVPSEREWAEEMCMACGWLG